VAIIAVVVLVAGCGTRANHEGASATSATQGASSPAQAANAVAVDGAPATALSPSAAAAQMPSGAAPPSRPSDHGNGTVATQPRPVQSTDRSRGSGGGGQQPGAVGAVPSPDAAKPAPNATPGVSVPPPSADNSPIVVASVGTYSGPAGVALTPQLQGAQLWVKHINQRGGLRGHSVRLLVYDDGGDPARHRAQVQDAREHHRAIAYLMSGDILTGGAAADYVTSNRIPVIGEEQGSGGWAYKSPMYFAQVPIEHEAFQSWLFSTADAAIPAGKTKLGIINCEVDSCRRIGTEFQKYAKAAGFDLVYQGEGSLAQPDFTASCLGARNAGVNAFFLGFDANSINRIITSCNRQGFRPLYAAPGVTPAREQDASNPNFDGIVMSSPSFPWFATGTPLLDEFRQALDTFGGGLGRSAGLSMGWTAGKLFEKAATKLGEPPTSEGLLEGLWSIKDDNLGGLAAAPLTFVRDRPNITPACWFNLIVRNGTWVSPDGMKSHCRTETP
jgi:branched-chain amino acid transport system substrate-binding protein